MAINVGEKYQHLLHRPGCNCVQPDEHTFPVEVIDRSRRGFLATMAASPLALAANSSAASAETATTSPASRPASLITKVNAAIEADTARLVEIFKDLHQHPELAFTETRTAGIVAKNLHELGYEVTKA